MSFKHLLTRKFLVAAFFALSGFVGLCCGLLTGGEYVALATLVTGLFAAANVVQDRILQPKFEKKDPTDELEA
jgi:hypothetical protein